MPDTRIIFKYAVNLSRIIAVFLIVFSKLANATNLIGAGDLLIISVYGHNDLKTETRVGDTGLIHFPLLGEISAGGKSSMELEEELAVKLIRDGFMHEAQVNVVVTEHVSQQVSLLGHVAKPGRYPLEINTTTVDLIAMAGGIIESGDDIIQHTRNMDGKIKKQVINLKDILDTSEQVDAIDLQAGDVLFVPKAPIFYIYGEVLKPGSYRLQANTTIVQALSLGGGLTPRGSESQITIKRRDNNGKLLEIDAELADTLLKDDVVHVGERWF